MTFTNGRHVYAGRLNSRGQRADSKIRRGGLRAIALPRLEALLAPKPGRTPARRSDRR